MEALTTANTLAAVVTETAIDVVRVTDGAASTLGTVAYTWAADDVFLLQRVGSSLIAAAYTEVCAYVRARARARACDVCLVGGERLVPVFM